MVSPRARRDQVRVPARAWPVATTCLWAARRCAFDGGVSTAAAGEGRAGTGGDASTVGAVSALWLPPHSHLPATGRSCDGHQSRASSVAPGWPWLAPQTTAASGCRQPASAVAAAGRQSRLGLRLRVRLLRQRPAAQVPDGGRRIHPRVPGDRRGRQHPLDAGHRRTDAADERAWRAGLLRSDSGPEFVSHAILQWLTDARIETAIIDPGKPWQNGTNEILQRQVPRRVLERGMVSYPPRSPGHHRGVAKALQRGTAAFEPRLLDPARIQTAPSPHSRPPQPSHFPRMIGAK